MRQLAWVMLLLCAITFALDLGADLGAEGLWFEQLGYFTVYRTQVILRSLLWLLGGGLSACFLGINFYWARRWQNSAPSDQPMLRLPQLMVAIVGICAGLMGLLVWQGSMALDLWQSVGKPLFVFPTLTWANLSQLGRSVTTCWPWFVGGSTVVLMGQGWSVGAIILLTSLGLGFIGAEHWTTVLAALHPTSFQETDPVFGLDLGFYFFTLPLWELMWFGWIQVSLVALFSTVLVYLRAGSSLSAGYFAGFTAQQTRHLDGLLGSVMGAIAAGVWLDRYALLYSTQGVLVGAGFTEVHVTLPAKTLLSLTALVLALIYLSRIILPPKIQIPTATLLIGYGVAIAAGTLVLPTLVQLTIVQPNELERERPYLAHSIRLTRQAFNLESIEVKTFSPKDQLTPALIQANSPTIRNIRLWDTLPLLEANRQLQRIRPYYEFPDADIDRYTLKAATLSPKANPTTEKRQVLIAARELDYGTVSAKAKTWINKRLTYTHGYGFTISPVNTAAPGGLPEYFVKDIGTQIDPSGLQTATPEIQASIPIGHPRIYFGEITQPYVITNTTVPELDYPKGDENAYNPYDGAGGIAVNTGWKRLLLAIYLHDWQMLLTQNFTPQTQVLFRRQIQARVQTIAPFLQLDEDPYLVVAQVAQQDSPASSNLYWMMDAYTTSDRYPYSDPGSQPFNYIRNSVKVVVDAHSGKVNFYAVEPSEPMLATWNKAFKGVFQPLDAMPDPLRSHIRYPLDLFKAQSQSLLTYHMSDPQVFYNREDPWRVPNEIYGSKEQPVEPYYLIMKLPEGNTEEFVLLYPFTPERRNNLIAWLAARSDGANYGKQLLYLFPKRTLVLGPEQIEALINQDPAISQQISLWNRQGSRVLQGNLLIIPIEQSLLYIEPLYIEAEINRVPTLARVIVVYQDRVIMASTLDQAFNQLFSANTPTAEQPTQSNL